MSRSLNHAARHEAAAAAMKAARSQKLRECAMLLYSHNEAAQALGVTTDEFAALLNDQTYKDAWRGGRLAVRSSIYASILQACRQGSVAAMKLALELAGTEADPGDNARNVDDILLLRGLER